MPISSKSIVLNLSVSLVILVFLSAGCKPKANSDTFQVTPQIEKSPTLLRKKLTLSKEELYDKVLGMLIGSAIGDAMGAPTEMWPRDMMQTEYGYISDLVPVIREPSPEGTWAYNLPPGGTTDDTRWKALITDFMTKTDAIVPPQERDLQAEDFAQFIINQYQADINELKETDSFDPAPYEQGMRQISWLQEWALVSKPYAEGDILAYTKALNRFYGGDMVCAGLLFAPALGVFYPNDPMQAYKQCYQIDIYDIGYARDLSSIMAAMVAKAMQPGTTADSLLSVVRDVDPEGYFKSRLVGRIGYNLLKDARAIVKQAKQTQISDIFKPGAQTPAIPANSPHDSLFHAQQEMAYSLLNSSKQYMPFHASEIYLVNLVALLFSNFDFQLAMEFVVNYGRDNDTTAAVTGALLGAYYGATKLPKNLVKKVDNTNKQLGFDFEAMAQRITDSILLGQP